MSAPKQPWEGTPCPECGGLGHDADRCDRCGGSGEVGPGEQALPEVLPDARFTGHADSIEMVEAGMARFPDGLGLVLRLNGRPYAFHPQALQVLHDVLTRALEAGPMGGVAGVPAPVEVEPTVSVAPVPADANGYVATRMIRRYEIELCEGEGETERRFLVLRLFVMSKSHPTGQPIQPVCIPIPFAARIAEGLAGGCVQSQGGQPGTPAESPHSSSGFRH